MGMWSGCSNDDVVATGGNVPGSANDGLVPVELAVAGPSVSVEKRGIGSVGDPVKDKEMMEKYSPVFHVDQIKAPLFVAQGANDPRVNKAESDQMVEALKKRGIEVEYMVKDNEGHGFHNEENKFDFYRAMDKFLSIHLKK